MTLATVETAEVIALMTREEAEDISQQIETELHVLADTHDQLVRLISEAITREAHVALGFRSAGEYVSIRFEGALTRLGVDARQSVVHELSAAGMSTRAIASVVGVSNKTVHQDRQVLPEVTPDTPVVGIDGKTYTRPAQLQPGETEGTRIVYDENGQPTAAVVDACGIDTSYDDALAAIRPFLRNLTDNPTPPQAAKLRKLLTQSLNRIKEI